MYNPDTHVPVGSTGCGKPTPYTPGQSVTATGKYNDVNWTWIVYVPKSYDNKKPYPVVIQHPGWCMSADAEEAGAGITLYADDLEFISVTAQGDGDNRNPGGPWYSWNAAGTAESPGPDGPTCTNAAADESYCYDSCTCPSRQCDWTTCKDTVTASGVGTNATGFIPSLYNTLESQLCIDTTREFAAGESNGGMQTYQIGVAMAHRLAAIAPQFGSFHNGFAAAPARGLPVIDIHGAHDETIPANHSLSADGWYYTTTKEIFEGGKYSTGWKAANGCAGPSYHHPTSFDGVDGLWCIEEGNCTGGAVVRCSWDGGHNWFGNTPSTNGGLVTEFLFKWTEPSHVGYGNTVGEVGSTAQLLDDVVVGQDPSPMASFDAFDQSLAQAAAGHYGDPDMGCLSDEEVVLVGGGRICAPKIKSTPGESGVHRPQCLVGGVRPVINGCPRDAAVEAESRSWPICLGKANETDAYNTGHFHCLLVCPCTRGDGCGAEGDAHCPSGATCVRGELRNRAQGVCTYHVKEHPTLVLATV